MQLLTNDLHKNENLSKTGRIMTVDCRYDVELSKQSLRLLTSRGKLPKVSKQSMHKCFRAGLSSKEKNVALYYSLILFAEIQSRLQMSLIKRSSIFKPV